MINETLIRTICLTLLPLGSIILGLIGISRYRRQQATASHYCCHCAGDCYCGAYHMLDCEGCGCDHRYHSFHQPF